MWRIFFSWKVHVIIKFLTTKEKLVKYGNLFYIFYNTLFINRIVFNQILYTHIIIKIHILIHDLKIFLDTLLWTDRMQLLLYNPVCSYLNKFLLWEENLHNKGRYKPRILLPGLFSVGIINSQIYFCVAEMIQEWLNIYYWWSTHKFSKSRSVSCLGIYFRSYL